MTLPSIPVIEALTARTSLPASIYFKTASDLLALIDTGLGLGPEGGAWL